VVTCLISDEGVHSMLLFNLQNVTQCGVVSACKAAMTYNRPHEVCWLI
jgi:hypothetical protein